MVHASNQVKIADGRITLYQRDDVKDGVWQCRMSVKDHKGYIRRSTGKSDLDAAKDVALQLLGELNQRKSQNLPLNRKTFAEVAAGYLKDAETRKNEGRNSAGRHAVIKGTLQRYLVPYFGKRDITLIQKKDLIDYRAWRQAYWVTGPGKDEACTHGDNRTIYSLRHTYSTLRLQNGTNVNWLKNNMGTSVTMIERHYGQTNVLMGIEHETAKRLKKKVQTDQQTKDPRAARKAIAKKKPIPSDELVPVGAVDMTPVDDGAED